MIALILVAQLATAETDPYYGWLYPPRDGTEALNRGINQELDEGLRALNHDPDVTCQEAAHVLTARLSATAAYYFAGPTRFWNVDRSPRTRTEYDDRYRLQSTYRYTALLPFGSLVPFDPTVRVGDTLFGTDKIGHFFTNGARAYDRYVKARTEEHATTADAIRTALMLGLAEERSNLGLGVSGVFSYADMEANAKGLELFRDLCERGDLHKVPSSSSPSSPSSPSSSLWELTRRFDIKRYVDPCWDEGFYPSAFADPAPVAEAIRPRCRVLKAARARRYANARCESALVDLVDDLASVNATPAPLTLDDVCADQSVPAGTSSTAEIRGTGARPALAEPRWPRAH